MPLIFRLIISAVALTLTLSAGAVSIKLTETSRDCEAQMLSQEIARIYRLPISTDTPACATANALRTATDALLTP